MVRQKPGSPSRQLEEPRQSAGFHHPNSKPPTKVWESMLKMSNKKCANGQKWVKMGANPKMPYPPCGRSIKTFATGNNDAPSITKYGSPEWLDVQIVALRVHSFILWRLIPLPGQVHVCSRATKNSAPFVPSGRALLRVKRCQKRGKQYHCGAPAGIPSWAQPGLSPTGHRKPRHCCAILGFIPKPDH